MQFLGTIVTILNSSVNNTNTTGTTFTIPPKWPRILIVTPADTPAKGFNITVQTGSTLASTASEFNIAGSTSTQVSCPVGAQGNTVLAVFVASGGTVGNVNVYGLWGPAQS